MKKVGVLGGGQLGLMLHEAAEHMSLDLAFLDPDSACSCASLDAELVNGSFNDAKTVKNFAKGKDILTVEIEHVSIEGLKLAESSGVKVYPQPQVLALIQDKGDQKEFYREHDFPTAPYELLLKSEELDLTKHPLPVVIKSRRGGYDGKGVKVLRTESDVATAFPVPCLVEQMADIRKELSVIVARSETGDVKAFPAVEMEFDPEANLVSALISPADIPVEVENEARMIAERLITKLDMVGLLAVEFFWLNDGGLWVNEVAPRPHNSGHQTIEGNVTSQYTQHLKAITGQALGDTSHKGVSVMVNLLGRPGHEGVKLIKGREILENRAHVFLHDYHKQVTRPFRKMGHATVLGDDRERALEEALMIQEAIRYESA